MWEAGLAERVPLSVPTSISSEVRARWTVPLCEAILSKQFRNCLITMTQSFEEMD